MWGLYLNISIILICFCLFLIYVALIRKKYKIDIYILFIILFCIIASTQTKYLDRKYDVTYKCIDNIFCRAIVISNKKEKNYKNSYEIKTLDNKTKLIIYVSKEQELKYGDLIEIEGEYIAPDEERNYKGFNYKQYLKTKMIYGTVNVLDLKVLKNNQANFIFTLSNNLRESILEQTDKIYNSNIKELVKGLMIGEVDKIEEDVVRSFRNSSLAHILSISGTHVSYIIFGSIFILENLKLSKKKTYFISILIIIIFMFITNFVPSVVRSCLSGIMMIFSKIVYRKQDMLTSLALSLLILLIINPFCIFDIGLQLSYTGVLGIIIFNNRIKKLLDRYVKSNNKILKTIKEGVAVSLSVQIQILPIQIINFNNINLVFIISNLIAIPILGLVMILGFISIFISYFIFEIAITISKFVEILLEVIIFISNITGEFKYANLIVVTPSIFLIISYYLLILFLINKKKKTAKYFGIIVVFILIIGNLVFVINQEFTIHFIDVGQR